MADLVKTLESESQQPTVGIPILPTTGHQQLPIDFNAIQTNSKIDHQARPASAVTKHGYDAPIDGVEMVLAQIWQKLLKLEQVDRHDNFFKLGDIH
ncbi:hypothetical protein [Xenorhabdus hominickii]|uniref:Carrier domain-containing protein n=1 Tax=Xenorhabdus hominickii TaxID=351679 RepID=A0ABM6DPC1_XENHO|nr:hypothetical protein [Xenorhabdus hominickii]AOM39805.1 hypothetical protein A9255_03960 [Xenorhabdus hominickii]